MANPTIASRRIAQTVLIVTFLPLCWLMMMAVHESGHALMAIATGGTVTKVVLHPMSISRTDIAPNPHPLLVVWSGPIIGVAAPIGVWLLTKAAMSRFEFLPRFWAGFCLIANGSYIGIGSMEAIGDTREMLLLNSPTWAL